MQNNIILEIKNLSKQFPGVKALDDVSIDIRTAEVHALLGENGAGKSTLIKILTGAYQKDEGEIIFNGEQVQITSPNDAINYGIGAVYQELTLIPQLSIMENMFLGNELLLNANLHIINWDKMKKSSAEILKMLDLNINPLTKTGALGVGMQQMVEIAKALVRNPKILIMDEPTSSLSAAETECLFDVVESLKKKGITIIYISHKLEEIMLLADRVTVLRDGKKVGTENIADINEDKLIQMMVGRSLNDKYPKYQVEIKEEALRIENFSGNKFKDVSFDVHHGEIIGVYGLVGAGRTEVARAIFGADPKQKGEIFIDGKPVNIKSPKDAIANGLAFLTEDRKNQGLILKNTLEFNINLSSLSINSKKWINLCKLKEKALDMVNQLKIQPPYINHICLNLSGGNQQKVVIAKWVITDANIFIFDEPTRGIDVVSKVEVYNVMNSLVKKGAAVIMISSEMEEILGMSDRIVVMHEGKVTAILNRRDATSEKICAAAIGRA